MHSKFRKNVSLKAHSNYKIGGPARYFYAPKNVRELQAALRAAARAKLEIFILGGGTNLLIRDRGWDGLVLAPRIKLLKSRKNEIEVGGGVPVADMLKFAVRKKLSGMEWAGGLPGTVGGAIRGNAGCFGGEIKDVVKSVTSMEVKTGRVRVRSNKECRFGYRMSVFKKESGKEIVIRAVFALAPGDPKAIARAIREKISFRKERHPMEYPNIGSIFKNVPLDEVPIRKRKGFMRVVKQDPFPVVPAAHLISEAGLKGVHCGGAMVSPKHPNFIVNALDATAEDVKCVIRLVKQQVKRKFGISLEEEVIVV